MNRSDIDAMWQKAMHQSIADGEQFTRYHFYELIASHVAEECARELSSSNQDLMLMCGEMTAQELRTTQAVLKAKAEAIRSLYKPTA